MASYNPCMLILGVVLVVVLIGAVCAIFFAGRDGPFVAQSHMFEDGDKLYGNKGNTDYRAGMRKPRDESELL